MYIRCKHRLRGSPKLLSVMLMLILSNGALADPPEISIEVLSSNISSTAAPVLSIGDNDNIAIVSKPMSVSEIILYTGTFGSWNSQAIPSTAGASGQYLSVCQTGAGDFSVSYYNQNDSALIYTGWVSTPWLFDIEILAGGNVKSPSIAINSAGDIGLSYYDATYGNLNFALNSGASWEVEIVESDGDVGSFNSLSVSSEDLFGITYYDTTSQSLNYAGPIDTPWQIAVEVLDGDPTSGVYLDLKSVGNEMHLVYFSDSYGDLKYMSNVSGSWHTTTIGNSNGVGRYCSLAIDGNGHYSMSAYDTDSSSLIYSGWLTTPWLFEIEVVSGENAEVPSIAINPEGTLGLSYYDSTYDNLKFAINSGAGWDEETVISMDDVGSYNALSVSSGNLFGISYYNATSQSMNYIGPTESPWNIAIETLDSNLASGAYLDIQAVESNLYLAYFSETYSDLKYMSNETGSWQTVTIANDGDIGRYCSLAVNDQGHYGVSAYDANSSSLVYSGWVTTPWLFEVEVIADGNAEKPSISINSEGQIGVSFYDSTYDNLKFALDTGVGWETETLQSIGDIGSFNAIGHGPTGLFGISYYDATSQSLNFIGPSLSPWQIAVEILDGNTNSGVYLDLKAVGNELHLVYFSDSFNDLKYMSNTSGSWQTADVSTSGDIGRYCSLAIDSHGHYSTSYYNSDASSLEYSGWVSTQWIFDIEIVAEGNSQEPSIAINSEGDLGLSYYDSIYDNLKFAINEGLSWNIETVISEGDVGSYSSVDVSSGGLFGISYYNVSGQSLNYVGPSLSPWQIAIETLDGNPNCGLYIDMQSVGNEIHLVYPSDTYGNLKYATNSSGSWNTTTIVSDGNVGSYCSLAIDSSGHFSASMYNVNTSALLYAGWVSTPWLFDIEVIAGSDTEVPSIAVNSDGTIGFSYYTSSYYDLKFASYNGASWTTETVISTGDVGSYNAISVCSDGLFGISYYDATSQSLNYVGPTEYPWQIAIEVLDDNPNSGVYLEMKSTGNLLHLVYFSDSYDNLHYMTNQSGSWQSETVATEGDIGRYCSFAIDNDGHYSSTAYDSDSSSLVYLGWITTPWVFDIEVVDVCVSGQSSICIDGNGFVEIAYQACNNGNIKYASKEYNEWLFLDVDFANGTGSYLASTINSYGIGQIAYYDSNTSALMFAREIEVISSFVTDVLVEQIGGQINISWDAALPAEYDDLILNATSGSETREVSLNTENNNRYTAVDSHRSLHSGDLVRYDIIGIIGTEQVVLYSIDFDVTPLIFTNILMQNYPNPFNPSTTVCFELENRQKVAISVVDMEGKVVALLCDNYMESGRHDIVWHGRDADGRNVASGTYFVVMKLDNIMYSKSLTLLK
jgi:hypothetical protein